MSEPTILCDFHMHTDRSGDSDTSPEDLVRRAARIGLGAIAVTDHNTIAGAVAAREAAARLGLDLHVIVGSEVKSREGEVIGLYLEHDIPRGLTFAETIDAIHAAGAVTYVPHPFQPFRSLPTLEVLQGVRDRIDVIETYNARIPRSSFNDRALAFARAQGLRQGAGSDAHVLGGVGTGCVRLAPFHDAPSLLEALDAGEIVRRPKNVPLLQVRKWFWQTRKRLRSRS